MLSGPAKSKIRTRICQESAFPELTAGTTPVISFGDFTTARVLTLGINPSSREFFSGSKLLSPSKKRLVDLEALGLEKELTAVPKEMAEKVWTGCKNYFSLPSDRGAYTRNPNAYWTWFGPMQQVLDEAGASYVDRTASHVDLVQWATRKAWSRVTSATRQALIEQDRAFLDWQLSQPNVELILVNGRSALKAVRENSSILWLPSRSVAIKTGSIEKNYELAWGVHSGGAMVAAWSINLQAAHFASGEMEEAIRLIAPIIREASSQDRHAVRAYLFPDYLSD